MNAILLLAALSAPLEATRAQWGDSVEVDVTMARCGHENAFYWPALQLVVMCRELPEAIQPFVLSHELGHAWMFQNDVPNSERGADELALLMSTREQAIAAADWFDARAKEYGDGDDGSHQGRSERAAAFRCVAYGLYLPDQTTALCRMYAMSMVENWARLGFFATLP